MLNTESNHVTSRCWSGMRSLREKVPALLSPWASHVLQPSVLCGFFFLLGSRWGEFIGFQFQDFLLWLQNEAFSWAFTALSLSFLTGSMDTEVTQSPSHLVKGKDQKAKMDCVPIKGHSCLLVSQEPGRSIRIFGLLSEARHCGRYSHVSTAIFSWVPPKLTLQPGNQLHRGSGLSSIFLRQQPVHSAACQLFLEHKLTVDPA